MRLNAPATLRPQWRDRGPTYIGAHSVISLGVPGAFAVYTVPADRRAVIESAFLYVRLNATLLLAELVIAEIEVIESGGGIDFLTSLSLQSSEPSGLYGPIHIPAFTLLTGDQVQINFTTSGSPAGECAGGIKGIEYDA